MFCPLHMSPILHGDGNECFACKKLHLRVIECELDKVCRTRDTMQQEGSEYLPLRSFAVLVFRKPPAEIPQ